MSKMLCAGTLSLLLGCVTGPDATAKLNTWNNEGEGKLTQVLGKPTETSPGVGGGKTIVYQFEEPVPHVVASHRAGPETMVTEYAQCTVRFNVDGSGHVKSSGIDEASERCEDLIPENPSHALAH